MTPPLAKRVASEFLGAAFLVMAVVGSGIMGDRLAGGNVAIALLANTIATGAALVCLILAFGPISGAHLNPAVSFAAAWQKGITWGEFPVYVSSQCFGAIVGTALAHLMFGLGVFAASTHIRATRGEVLAEFIAAFGLVLIILAVADAAPAQIPFAVAAYITAAYWFTSSTSFANPAVTIARCLTDTFSGIRPADAPAFILAQFAGAITATLLFRWFKRG